MTTDEIMKLADAYAAATYEEDATTRAALLKAVEEMAVDAARYRFLELIAARPAYSAFGIPFIRFDVEVPSVEIVWRSAVDAKKTIGETIDAAIRKDAP